MPSGTKDSLKGVKIIPALENNLSTSDEHALDARTLAAILDKIGKRLYSLAQKAIVSMQLL